MKRVSSAAIMFLLLASGFALAVVPSVPKAHAVTPSLSHYVHASGGSSVSLKIHVTAGDYLYVGSTNFYIFADIATVSDNMSSNFNTNIAQETVELAGGSYYANLYLTFVQVSGTGTDLVSEDWGCGGYPPCSSDMFAWDVSGATTANHLGIAWCGYIYGMPGTGCAQGYNRHMGLTAAISFDSSNIFLVGIGMGGSGAEESGYKYVSGSAIFNSTGAVSSPTHFAFSGNGSYWGVIGGTASSTVTVVVPCSFFQLECWAYPAMFMAMYLGFFIGVGVAFRVSEKAFMYLILAGATYGSLIEIQMGIMTATVPIILIILNISYSFRLDRLIVGAVSRGQGQP